MLHYVVKECVMPFQLLGEPSYKLGLEGILAVVVTYFMELAFSYSVWHLNF